MPNANPTLPSWLKDKYFCTNKDLQRLFGVSRATLDRWSREDPTFPRKIKLSLGSPSSCATRFLASDVVNYLGKMHVGDDEA